MKGFHLHEPNQSALIMQNEMKTESYRTVQAQCDEHYEEHNGPSKGPRQSSDSFWVYNEHQARTYKATEHLCDKCL